MQSSSKAVVAVAAATAIFASGVGVALAVRAKADPSTEASRSVTVVTPSMSPSAATSITTAAETPHESPSETPATSETPDTTPTLPTALDASTLRFKQRTFGTGSSMVTVEAPIGWTLAPVNRSPLDRTFNDSTGIRNLRVDASHNNTHGKTVEDDAAAHEKYLLQLEKDGKITLLRFLSRRSGSVVAKGADGLERAWASRDFTYTNDKGEAREVHIRWVELNAGQSADPTSVVITVGGSAVDYAALTKITDQATRTVLLAG